MTDAPAASVLVPQSSTTDENLEEVRGTVTLGNIQRMLESEQEVVRGGRTAEQPLNIKTDTPFDVWRMNKLCNRRWMEVGHHSSPAAAGIEFTMATYNVLAQNLLEDNSYLYTSANRDWLAWNYRQKNLLAEISFYNPDILCCQEINEQHYVDFFYPEMQKLGYQGAFKKRTRAMHDGCATFFKTSTFECDAFVPVEYLKTDVPVLDRDNVALLLLLRPKNAADHGTKICVANTHLLFNPRRGDVKLAQLMTLFAEIDQLAFRPDPMRGSSYHPVLFCGDLNMEPFSRLYEFISEGSLNIDGLNVRSLSGQEQASPRAGERMMGRRFLDSSAGITDQSQYVNVCRGRAELVRPAADTEDEDLKETPDKSGKSENPGFTQGSGKISHSFRLKSVYPHIDIDTRGSSRRTVREITTAHDRGNCTVDYIFYSGGLPRRSFSLDSLPSLSAAEPIRKSASFERVGEKRPSSLENPNDRLQLLSRLELISDCDMKKIGKLPNELISSDHLLLAAKFLLKS
jgi:protein angel